MPESRESVAALSILVAPQRLFTVMPMQTILPSEFKRQMVLMLEGSPHVVEDMHTSGTLHPDTRPPKPSSARKTGSKLPAHAGARLLIKSRHAW